MNLTPQQIDDIIDSTTAKVVTCELVLDGTNTERPLVLTYNNGVHEVKEVRSYSNPADSPSWGAYTSTFSVKEVKNV